MMKLLPQQWLNQLKDPKRRVTFFFLGLIILSFFWFVLLLNPLRVNKNKLKNQIPALQLQITEIQQQIDTINQAVKTNAVVKSMTEQQQLSKKIASVQQRLAKVSPLLITLEDWIKLKKAIISQQTNMDNSITLESISELPEEPWVPQAVDKTDVANAVATDVYVQALEVKFQADYFSTIQYLGRLEKLPWPIYWDSLEYKVQTYPKADVIIKFHTFTKQPGEA